MATLKRPAPPFRPTLTALVPSDQAPGGAKTFTVGDLIVDQVKAGVDLINAAGVAGVTSTELQAWIREGTLVFNRLGAGSDWSKDFTPDQQDMAVFADRVIRARSTHISTLSVIADRAARGGQEKTTVRRKSVAGQVVEETVITERTLPDMDVLKWKLEKLEPSVYGSKATLNVTVTDLTDTEAVGESWEKRMNEIAAALSVEAIETTGDV